MREYISVDREANAIRLRRSAFSGTFLLVEGSSDKIFYQRFIDKQQCKIVVVSGKPSSKYRVIKILEILDGSSFAGVLGIVDADCDRLNNLVHKSPNLLATDTHDLETTLIKSPALDKVILEFGSEEKIVRFKQDIRQILIDAGIVVGYLRWISQVDELNFTFNSIVFSKFIDEKTLGINELKLFKEVKNKSHAFALSDADLQNKLSSRKNQKHDPWQVCCGHDLVQILALGLRKTIGTNKASEIEASILERSLRLAYDDINFTDTQLYLEVRDWETTNTPYIVLKSEV